MTSAERRRRCAKKVGNVAFAAAPRTIIRRFRRSWRIKKIKLRRQEAITLTRLGGGRRATVTPRATASPRHRLGNPCSYYFVQTSVRAGEKCLRLRSVTHGSSASCSPLSSSSLLFFLLLFLILFLFFHLLRRVNDKFPLVGVFRRNTLIVPRGVRGD